MLISYIIIYYIIIKLLIMENHPSQNQKQNSLVADVFMYKLRDGSFSRESDFALY
jgi:hypothetical protein